MPLLAAAVISGCTAKGDNPGLEYAPQMYHSIPYEPLTQIKDKEKGSWLSNREDGLGEFHNPMRTILMHKMQGYLAGAVRRNGNGILPYRLGKNDIEAASLIENPFEDSPEVKEKERGYMTFIVSIVMVHRVKVMVW